MKTKNTTNKTQKLIQYDKNFDDDSILCFVIHPQSNPTLNLIANLFEKETVHKNKIFLK